MDTHCSRIEKRLFKLQYSRTKESPHLALVLSCRLYVANPSTSCKCLSRVFSAELDDISWQIIVEMMRRMILSEEVTREGRPYR